MGGLVRHPKGRAFEYARSAKALALAGRTWDHRIDLVLQAGEAVRGALADEAAVEMPAGVAE